MSVEKRVSIEGLTRCTRCRRHVEAAETPSATRCPFCDRKAPMSSRGALLAASLFAAACTRAEPAAEGPVAKPEQEPVAEPQPAAEPQPVPTPEPAPTPEADPEPDAFEPEPAAPMPAKPRYGRAPSRPKVPLKK